MENSNSITATTLYHNALHLFNEERFEDALTKFLLARDSMLSTCDRSKDIKRSKEYNRTSPISTPKKDKLKKELAQVTISKNKMEMNKSETEQDQSTRRQHTLYRFDEGFQTFNNRIENEESFPHGMSAILYKIGKVYENMGNINDALASYHDAITWTLKKCSDKKDCFIIVATLNNIGKLHYLNENLENALKSFAIASQI